MNKTGTTRTPVQKKTPTLGSLLEDTEGLEKNVTGSDDGGSPAPAAAAGSPSSPAIPQAFTLDSFSSFFQTNPAFKGEKRETINIFTPIHLRFKRLALAENSDMTTLINNILQAWLDTNKDQEKKSLKKLLS